MNLMAGRKGQIKALRSLAPKSLVRGQGMTPVRIAPNRQPAEAGRSAMRHKKRVW